MVWGGGGGGGGVGGGGGDGGCRGCSGCVRSTIAWFCLVVGVGTPIQDACFGLEDLSNEVLEKPYPAHI